MSSAVADLYPYECACRVVTRGEGQDCYWLGHQREAATRFSFEAKPQVPFRVSLLDESGGVVDVWDYYPDGSLILDEGALARMAKW